jgi:acyl-CoA thioester hydrolase
VIDVYKRGGVYKNPKLECRSSKQIRNSKNEKARQFSLFFELRTSNFEFRIWTAQSVSAVIFHHCHRVTYSECTLGNHVYYSRYLEILEIARGEFFRQLGSTFLQWQEQDTIFPVVECRLRYKAPARYDDLLKIEIWLTSLERIRVNFAYRILNQENLLLEGETFHVCTGIDEKPKKLPAELQLLLKPYLQLAT